MGKNQYFNGNFNNYFSARALYEFDVRDQFFGQSGTGIRFFVLVLPKEGKNILDEKMLKETVEVNIKNINGFY